MGRAAELVTLASTDATFAMAISFLCPAPDHP
jgi:hypothetical protein